MKAIGGYFPLECGKNPPYHKGGIYLNSGCSALRLVIRERGLKQVYVPDYTCPVVHAAVKKENCECIPYSIGKDFLPVEKLPADAFIICNNYFGICSKQVDLMAERYPHLIVDNAQAFYMPLRGIASFYSPRKFFGVPDGGILLDKEISSVTLERGKSAHRCAHLLKRIDDSAENGYQDFQNAEILLEQEGVLAMSALTSAMLGNCDYTEARKRRLENFDFLHQHLKKQNRIQFSISDADVPLVYPYLAGQSELRQLLIHQKVFVAKYWPKVENCYFSDLTALPIDQRYGICDMERIVRILNA